MRVYEIFLVQKDVVKWYLHKEETLFQLFLDVKRLQSAKLSPLLQKQIDFITHPIDMPLMDTAMNTRLSTIKEYDYHRYHHEITLNKGNSYASLNLFPKKLVLKGIGLPDAEHVFFEMLRKIEDTFIAVDYTHRHIGFLKPVRRALIK